MQMTLSDLPPDCAQNVFAHLSLHDCLSYGTASLSSFRDVLADIDRRQKRLLQPFLCLRSALYCSPAAVGLLEDGEEKEIEEELFLKTTILERVKYLSRYLPLGHPMNKRVDELASALSADEERRKCGKTSDSAMPQLNDGSKNENHSMVYDEIKDYLLLLEALRSLTLGHKLHAAVLSDSLRLDPQSIERGNSGTLSGRGKEKTLTVTLEQYIGDVLCTYFLMEHSAVGIVEGGPTKSRWVAETLYEIFPDILETTEERRGKSIALFDKASVSATQWYRAWILLHCMVLYTIPFPERIRIILSLSSRNNIPESLTSSTSTEVLDSHDHSPSRHFRDSSREEIISCLTKVAHLYVPLSVTYNSFGRLGPTFRGRDHIQTRTIDAPPLVCAMVYFLDMPLNIRNSNDHGLHPTLECLIEMHVESRKTRPMTVAPPLVTINCFNS